MCSVSSAFDSEKAHAHVLSAYCMLSSGLDTRGTTEDEKNIWVSRRGDGQSASKDIRPVAQRQSKHMLEAGLDQHNAQRRTALSDLHAAGLVFLTFSTFLKTR